MKTTLYACKCGEMQINDMGTHISTTKAIDCHISKAYIKGVCIRCQRPFQVYWHETMSMILKPAHEPVASKEQELMIADGHRR